MGATKTADENEVRWMFGNNTIDPRHSAWLHDPLTDRGQFYAKRDNVSCFLMGKFPFFTEVGWGQIASNLMYDAGVKGFCERAGITKIETALN